MMHANPVRPRMRLRDHVAVWLLGVLTGAASVVVAVLVAAGAERVAFGLAAALLVGGISLFGAALWQGAHRSNR